MSHLDRSLKSSSVAEMLVTYNDWAESYNHDLEKEEYTAPQLAAECLANQLGSQSIRDAKILDAGCGTGLVGDCLAKYGATQIDGLDLSPGMLTVAKRTGVYRSLNEANLAERLDLPSQSYDALICVGTMTAGHVGPEAFDEFIRVVKSGGIIVSTVRESVWQGKGYEAKVESLIEAGKARLVGDQLASQRIGVDVRAIFVVLRVQ